MSDRLFIYHIALPDGINEAVLPCLDGYTIYLNEKLSPQKREDAFWHAIEHIQNHDFEKTDVQEIESQAHKKGDK